MKKLGIALIIIGIVITIFTGITFKKEETVAEIGDIEITREKEQDINWPQWAGVAVMAAGVVVLIAGRKKR